MKPSSTENADAALPFRMRSDLLIQRQPTGEAVRWVIKDPVSERYYEFMDHEFRLIQLLDGTATVNGIQRELAALYGAGSVSESAVLSYVRQLHATGIVHCDIPGEGDRLLRRSVLRRSAAFKQQLLSVLFIRFRGIDPDRFLQSTLNKCPWLFSRGFVAAGILLIGLAIAIVTVQFDLVTQRLPEMSTFVGFTNLVWIAVAISITKILHELGHAFACKRLGGECHDLGLLFLVFAPCLYCDVSDSWMMTNRWHRIAVAAAGIYVDLVVAACCTLLWWSTHPGWFNSWCLNLMIVCSVATLVFNANPLLRYDGYFILSDMIAIPNLMKKALDRLKQGISQVLFGVSEPDVSGHVGWRSRFLIVYAVLSVAYRCVLMIAIYRLIHMVLNPYGLGRIADALGVLMLVGVFQAVLKSCSSMLRFAHSRHVLMTFRGMMSLLLVIAAVYFIFFIPVRRTARVPLFIDLSQSEDVYTPEDVEVVRGIDEEPAVVAGQEIAKLQSVELQEEMSQIQTSIQRVTARMRAIQASRFGVSEKENELPELQQTREALEKQLEELVERSGAMTLSARSSGVFIDPPERNDSREGSSELPGWQGVPLDPRNEGVTIPKGTLIGRVGQQGEFEGRIAFEESLLPEIAIGQHVDIVCEQSPHQIIHGRITQISQVSVDDGRLKNLLLWNLPVQLAADGTPRLATVYYEARVGLDISDPTLRVFVPGAARIHLEPLPVATQITRFLQATFRAN